MRRPATLPSLLLVLAVTASCGGSTDSKSSTPTTPTPPAPVLTTISVILAPASIQVGQTASATATGSDQNGAAFALGSVAWTSSNTGVAAVNGSGAITTSAAGQSIITATSNGKSGQATLTVAAVPVTTTVTVTLSASSVIQNQTVTATAVALDQNGNPLANRQVAWTTAAPTIASISTSGVVTGSAPGQTQVVATIDGKQGQSPITVTAAPVATVAVVPATASLTVGQTQQLTATARDAAGNVLTRTITWTSSDNTKATVSANGLVTAVARGNATITASADDKSAGSSVVVSDAPSQQCTASTSLKLALGEARTLSAAQAASLCIGGAANEEFALVAFNNSNVAATTTSLSFNATNAFGASALSTGRVASLPNALSMERVSSEASFRARERSDLGSPRARELVRGRRLSASREPRTTLTGVPANPAVGSFVQLNANLSGNTCTSPKLLHTARVVGVLPHTIVFVDSVVPAGGYTDAELMAFGTAFDQVGFALDTLNFGAPTDIDGNGRIGIYFTWGVNLVPGPPGGYVAGLFAGRDLLQATTSGCPASNEGEMFYIPVPDPNSTLNGTYRSKATLASGVLPVLVHEFQHLINAGRRLYVNNSGAYEEVWLNEGLSHIAEELLFYRTSGKTAYTNLSLDDILASQAFIDAFNTTVANNFGRYSLYLAAPTSNSPYATNDNLETRGAIWSLLRYAADLKAKGGNERPIWFSLVNTSATGQANFAAAFGDIVAATHDWAIAQVADDGGFPVDPRYTTPSWNFRSIFPALSNVTKYPLATLSLPTGAPLTFSVSGGAAAYIRFRVRSGLPATITTPAGTTLPANIDFVLVRTL